MTPEVKEIVDALVAPSPRYCGGRMPANARYEALRQRLIAQVGYDAFRDRQREAFRAIVGER